MPGKLQEGALCSFFYMESRHEAAGTSSNTANLEVAMLELCLARSTLAAKQECAKQALVSALHANMRMLQLHAAVLDSTSLRMPAQTQL
jgi:hypothetical protein